MGSKVLLGDVVRLDDSRRQPLSSRQRENRKGRYPYYGAQGIVDYLDDYTYDGTYLLVAEDGENLRSRKLPLANLVTGKFRVNNHAHVLAGTDRCDIRVLGWLLNSMNLTPYVTGSTQPKLSQKNLLAIELYLPSIDEQRSIMAILGAIDSKITLNQRTNDYLLQLANLQIKNYLQSNANTELVTVRDFTKSMSNGATPSRKNTAFWDGGTIPWVKTGEVNNDLILSTEEQITQLALDKTSVRLLPVNTVIMALYGSGTAGRLGILQTPATTNQACTAMVCESEVEAFYLFLTLQGMYRQIDNMTRGSVQQNLSKDMVASLKVPRLPEQALTEMGLSQYYAQIAVNKLESARLASMRDTLLPKLMSGEIDVSGAELPTQPNNHLYAG